MKRQKKKKNQYNDQKKKYQKTNIDPQKTKLGVRIIFADQKKKLRDLIRRFTCGYFAGFFCVFNQVFNFYNTSILILHQLRLPIMKETVNNSTRRKLHANRSLQAKQIQIMKKYLFK